MRLQQLALVLFTVIAVAPLGSAVVLFESDWSNATGFSEAAYTDGGKWDFVSADRGVPNKEIVSTAGLDFPTANAYNVICTAAAECWSQLRVTTLPVPSVGESRYYRWYFRSVQPDNLEDGGTHPIETGGSDVWALEIYNNPLFSLPAGQYAVWFYVGESTYNNQRWYIGTEQSPIPFNKHQTYRFEVHVLRTGAATMNLHIRVYDSNDVLLYDDADIHNPAGVSLASNPSLALSNPASLSTWQVGNNGIGGTAPFPFTYAYEGAFCIRDDDWCGPYGSTSPPPDTGEAIPGDLNEDGAVNLQDLLIVIQRLGRDVSGDPRADVNSDGAINVFDVVRVARHWGNTAGPDTTPPTSSISAPTANQVLSAGTTSTTLTVTTNEAATCRWSTSNQAYSSMPAGNTLNGGGGTSHTTTLTGLSNGQSYTRYVRCQDTEGNAMTSSQSVAFSVASTSAPTGLVAAYSFDEGSGTSAADASGNGHTGTVNGGATWAAGRSGTALQLDGQNDFVNIPHASALNLNQQMTLMAWVNTPGTGTYANLIMKNGLSSGYGLFLNGLTLEHYIGGYSGASAVTVPANTWTHVALTSDGTTVRIYRNGVESRTMAAGVITTNTDPLRIGVTGTTGYFQGLVDDVRIYDLALSAVEIQSAMNTPVSPPPADTVPPTAMITAPNANQALIAGTTQTQLSATTNEASTCRWSTTNQAYGLMPNTMTGAGGTSHSATLTGLSNGQSYTRYVRCQDTAGNAMTSSQSVAFSVATPGGAGGVLFESDWSTAIGTSSEALLDGARWSFLSDGGGKEIISSSGLDFPTSNVLRVTHESSSSVRIYKDSLTIPAVGESRYYRWYIRVAMPDDLSDGSTHPIEATSGNPWAFEIENSPNRGVPAGHFGIWFLSHDETTPNHRWYLGENQANLVPLDKHVTYRVEYQFHRTGADTYSHDARVYDSQNNLLYDEGDFHNYDGSMSMADDPDLNMGDINGLERLQVGNNGIAGSGPFPFVYTYQAAFCIRSDTWCGPYSGGTSADTTPPTATIGSPTANQVLAAGTTSTSLAVTTNEPSTCRWSTSNQAYSSMPAGNALNGGGGMSHSATLTGLSNGQAYTRHVRCQDTAGNAMASSQSVSFSVANPGSSGGLLFASDWSTATGFSENAYTDGGKWDFVSADRGVPNKEIVPSTGLDFPSANVFNVLCTAVAECWSQVRVTTLPVPAVGESRYYRWYFRLMEPDNLEDSGTHPIETGGADNWAFEVYNNPSFGLPAGQYAVWFAIDGESTYNNMRWYIGTEQSPIPFHKGVTYRFEVHVLRTGTGTMNLHIRVYDSNDVLLYDDANIHNPIGVSLASTPSLALGNPASLSTWQVGNNGIGGTAPFPFTYAYEGAFCLRSDTWCGPYQQGEAS